MLPIRRNWSASAPNQPYLPPKLLPGRRQPVKASAVLAPRRLQLLARTQNSGVQTIQIYDPSL